jgi:hypothetical protein
MAYEALKIVAQEAVDELAADMQIPTLKVDRVEDSLVPDHYVILFSDRSISMLTFFPFPGQSFKESVKEVVKRQLLG